jgi:hypothetical protein
LREPNNYRRMRMKQIEYRAWHTKKQ